MLVAVNDENKEKCLCRGCPSYNECMKEAKQNLFCGTDKSSCKIEKKGCLCMGCPVYMESKLKGGYFCIMGKVD